MNTMNQLTSSYGGKVAMRDRPGASAIGFHPLTLLVLLSLVVECEIACAEFGTVINSPGYVFDPRGYIPSHTQVNLYPGGVMPGDYPVGPAWEQATHIEINLLGGSIGDERTGYGGLDTGSRWVTNENITVNLYEGTVTGHVIGRGGALVTLQDATVKGGLTVTEGSLATLHGGRVMGQLTASKGSSVQMSGGVVGSGSSSYMEAAEIVGGATLRMSGGELRGALRLSDSYASLTGGNVLGRLQIDSFGEIDIAGGSYGSLQVYGNGKATLMGGEFALDGVPLEGVGTTPQPFDFPEGSLLTGVLRDGTPILLANMGLLHDSFAYDTIDLRAAPLPAVGPASFDAPGDDVPRGLRAGQSLTLREGGHAAANFAALPGSVVSILGGSIGHGFEAAGASVTVATGSIGERATIYQGTTLKLLGGEIGSNFEAAPDSRLEMKGGKVGEVFVAHPASEVVYSGGKFAGYLTAMPESSFAILGGDFKLDGMPVVGLDALGTRQQLDLPESGVLSGTLSDGTPFAFSGSAGLFAPGTLTLQSAPVAADERTRIEVPSDPAPLGLRTGQTLVLRDGGEIGRHFTADWGSAVQMSGGRIGYGFEAVGTLVNATGGELESIDALVGSVVNLTGASVSHRVSAHRGSIVNLTAGEVASLYAREGGRVNMSGGMLTGSASLSGGGSMAISGGVIQRSLHLYDGGRVNLTGGEVQGEISALSGSSLFIGGGRLADRLYVAPGGMATLRGTHFRIDGEPLSIGGQNGVPQIDLPTGGVLSGVFADGTPFAFTPSEGELFSPGTLYVSDSSSKLVPGAILTIEPTQGLRHDEQLTLGSGEEVGANFTAGWGSRLTVAGGQVGTNFEAVGAKVDLIQGSIGEDMDALFGSEINISGGTVGKGLQAHRGSIVNISGGIVSDLAARTGSKVSISGGTFGYPVTETFYAGNISLEAGSELRVIGTDFLLDGNPIAGLEDGNSLLMEWNQPPYRFFTLSARLLDGSYFYAHLSSDPIYSLDGWQYSGASRITLMTTSDAKVVPEPASFAM